MLTIIIEIFLFLLLIGIASYLTCLNLSSINLLAYLTLLLSVYSYLSGLSILLKSILWIPLVLIVVLMLLPSIRIYFLRDTVLKYFRSKEVFLSDPQHPAFQNSMPLWSAGIFSGKFNFDWVSENNLTELTEQEIAFIEGPVDLLCGMLEPYRGTKGEKDLPVVAWQFMQEHAYFGLCVSEEFEGRAFSSYAYSCVGLKIMSRSITAGLIFMSPKVSTAIALITAYATDEQKKYYLPRIAKGKEVPSITTSEPGVSGITNKGLVCYQLFEGSETQGILLAWNQSTATLPPVTTLLCMAFDLFDPHHILGDEENLGMTFALVPSDAPTMKGRTEKQRALFETNPALEKNVFIPMDWVLGGRAQLGQASRLLRECQVLGIMPTLATAATKFIVRNTSAYLHLDTHTQTSNHKDESENIALASIATYLYMMDAVRTLSAIDIANKESFKLSEVVGSDLTGYLEQVVGQAKQLHLDMNICNELRERIAHIYKAFPADTTLSKAKNSVSDEQAANRSFISKHPWILCVTTARVETNNELAVENVDEVIWKYLADIHMNIGRSLFLGFTNSAFESVPFNSHVKKHYKSITRLIANFALVASLVLIKINDSEEEQSIVAKLESMLSSLCLCLATLKFYYDRDEPALEKPFLDWAMLKCQHDFHSTIQKLLSDLFNPVMRWIVCFIIYPLGKPKTFNKDGLNTQLMHLLLEDHDLRDALTGDIFIPTDVEEPIQWLEDALQQKIKAMPLMRLVKRANKLGRIEDPNVDQAVEARVITDQEADVIRNAELAKQKIFKLR